MSWSIRVIHEVGRNYSVQWIEEGTAGHYHRCKQPISKEDFEARDKWERFNISPRMCDECGEEFTSRGPSFGSSPVYDTADGKPHVGDIYNANHGGHESWWVVLPGGSHFDIHSKSSTDGKPWAVSGDPPNITLSPSVVIPRQWHGFIQNGVITDDVEGRTY